MTNFIHACDDYLGARTGKYDWRAIRYRATADFMTDDYFHAGPVLTDEDTVFDVGAGWTEFDYTLRREYDWRGRYIPIDGGIDGVDINGWIPRRRAEWFVGLEIIEHLHQWNLVINRMKLFADKGVVLSTPNPRTTDVLGMDHTHVAAITQADLEALGFVVSEQSFYGAPADSLFATWTKK